MICGPGRRLTIASDSRTHAQCEVLGGRIRGRMGFAPQPQPTLHLVEVKISRDEVEAIISRAWRRVRMLDL